MTALLVNLAQRRAGRMLCLAEKGRVLALLGDMLEHESLRVREYVHGVLYSLLKMPGRNSQNSDLLSICRVI